ncbi:MAG: peptidoglycan editing factor PgeF [Eubacteriales bacterium]|nr:peptidoglycan editing factor PgeF [Eubacteriales bacterium]
MFRLVKNGNLCYYTIDAFENTGLVKHCFTTKHGGVSEGCYESLNLRMNCDDSEENIHENYRIICNELGIDVNSLVLSKQVHKTDIAGVTSADKGNGFVFENKFESADALVTNEKNVPLVTFFADCVPVFLLDTKKEVLALVHSGWRGTANGISALTVQHMIEHYGSTAEDIIAAIGPSIRKCHFEVGDEVAAEFDERFVDRAKEKPYVDLQGCIIEQLIGCGVKRENITDSGICTCCRCDEFYSHRTTGNERGTMAAIAMLV